MTGLTGWRRQATMSACSAPDKTQMKRIEGKKILLVDDEESVRSSIQMLLESSGAIVTEASNGGDALKLWEAGTFDCLVTDYKMPNMRGDALAEIIKTANPRHRVVMLSGFAPEVLRDGRLPWFLDVLLHKPCSMEELLCAIEPSQK